MKTKLVILSQVVSVFILFSFWEQARAELFVTTGHTPDTFNSPTFASIKQLNDLYRTGRMSYTEYESRLAWLEKSVSIVSMSGVGTTPIGPLPSPRNATLSLATPRPKTSWLGNSEGTPAVVPPVRPPHVTGHSSDPAMVYTRWSTPLHIEIYDDGYGLSQTDLQNIQGYLDRLPITQLAGLTRIDWCLPSSSQCPVPSASPASGLGMGLIISGPHQVPPPYNWSLLSQLAYGIGGQVYQLQLTLAQRADWDKAAAASYPGIPPADIFASFYAGYTINSQAGLDGAAHASNGQSGHPPTVTNGQTFPMAVLIPVPIGPSGQAILNAGLSPDKALPLALFMASQFAASNGVLRMYDVNSSGQSIMNYSSASQTSSTLTVGNYVFTVQGGKITGFTRPISSTPVPGTNLVTIMAEKAEFHPGITLPATVLALLAKM